MRRAPLRLPTGFALAALVCVVARSPFARADDAPARAFVEVEATPREAYVGQAVTVVLRVGYDATWLASNAAPLFAAQTDLPLQVLAPHLRGIARTEAREATPLAGPEAATTSRTLAVNETRASAAVGASVERDGVTFATVVLARVVFPTAPGELRVAAPTLRLRVADAFETDAVGTRRAVRAHEVLVEGRPAVVTVRDAPPPAGADGRAEGAPGAIGAVRLRASVDRDEVAVGEAFRLTLVLEGEGNLERFEPPRPTEASGLHVLGAFDDRGVPRRTVRYEVEAVRDDVTQVPAIALPWLDPGPPATYRVARSAPIPLRVRPGTPRAGDPPSRPARASPPPDAGPVTPLFLAAAGAGLLALLAVLLRTRRRARRLPPRE